MAGRGGGRLWLELLSQAVALGGLLWGLKVCLGYLDPYREQRDQAKKRAAFLKRYLGVSLELNEFEQLLVANVLNPAHIDVTLDDVHGLDSIVTQLNLKVIYPLLKPGLYNTSLLRQTKGVLLYGPPGTGKTMLAKALARESGCFFLNITASSIISKWLGDANRLVKAVFSLAAKLEPCIIFIDEVDAMLGKRGATQEHEATLQVKTEFMQLWDGIESTRSQRVVVMGATNRPWMVDEAVLRRFTLQYEIGLPDKGQRRQILLGYLRKHRDECGPRSVAPELLGGPALPPQPPAKQAPQPQPQRAANGNGGANTAQRDLDWVSASTEGFSGSDLLELCSQAAQHVLEEHWMEEHRRTVAGAEGSPPSTTAAAAGDATLQTLKLRPICGADFEHVLGHIRPSGAKAEDYSSRTGHGGGGGSQAAMLEAMLAAMMAGGRGPTPDP